MLVVETIARIRRAHFVQGKSIKAICRELGVSRKVLRSEVTEFRYEREQQPMPRLGAWREELDRLLLTQRGEVQPGAADADPCVRGVACLGLRGWLRRGAALSLGVTARAGLQPPVPADVQPLSGRAGGMHPGVRLEERLG